MDDGTDCPSDKGASSCPLLFAAQSASTTAQLLDYEPRAAKQVPLLLSMKEDNLALVKAIDSGDPDLVYSVLSHLKRSHSLGNFFRFVDNKPDAAALLAVAAKRDDRELLRDFYFQDDRRTETACLALEEALTTEVRLSSLFWVEVVASNAQDFAERMSKVRQGAKSFAEDKERAFEGKVRLSCCPVTVAFS